MAIPERFLRPPVTVHSTADLEEAARQMKESRVGCLVVVDEDGRVVGVVTDRDVALAGLRSGRDPREAAVGEVMASPAVLAEPTHSVLDCAHQMRRHGVRRLPIVDGDRRPIGIVSADDLMEMFVDNLRWIVQAERTGFEHEADPQHVTPSVFGKE